MNIYFQNYYFRFIFIDRKHNAIDTFYSFVFQCSVSCGVGTQQRHVFCQSEEETLSDDLCSEDQPIRTQECRRNTCATWQTTYWTAVSITALLEFQSILSTILYLFT